MLVFYQYFRKRRNLIVDSSWQHHIFHKQPLWSKKTQLKCQNYKIVRVKTVLPSCTLAWQVILHATRWTTCHQERMQFLMSRSRPAAAGVSHLFWAKVQVWGSAGKQEKTECGLKTKCVKLTCISVTWWSFVCGRSWEQLSCLLCDDWRVSMWWQASPFKPQALWYMWLLR